MMHSASTLIRIDTQAAPAGLSKGQKRFNQLIRKIDQQRKQLLDWQQTIPLYQQKHAQEFEPLTQTLQTLQSELVQLLDKRYPEKAFTLSDRKKMRHLICNIAGNLMVEDDNKTLKAIYNRHSETDFDAELEEGKEAIKEMMQAILGVELDGEIDLRSPEHLFSQVGEQMQQKMEQEARSQQEPHKPRKKSAKTLAKEKRAQEEAQTLSKSIQEVYRKLASSLHPDKEPDPSERDRKTQLMQQVNTAYEKKDLLRLLELQLEAEQINQTTINTLNETRLAHYNKILSEQSKELEAEVLMMRGLLTMRLDIPEEALSTPDRLLQSLDVGIRSIKRTILGLQGDLAAFQDTRKLKQFLKSFRPASRSPLAEAAREMGVTI